MDRITLTLRPGLGLNFEAMRPALQVGAAVAIGRGGAVIEAVSLQQPSLLSYDPNRCLACGENHGNGSLPCPNMRVTGASAEIAQVHPEQAEGAQGEREALADAVRVLLEVPQLRGDQAYSAQPIIERVRAALAQPSPAPELERPEVVESFRAILGGVNGLVWEYMDRFTVEPKKHGEIVQLIRLSDFDRIVGALRDKVAQLSQYNVSLNEESARIFADLQAADDALEAAQARVAELDKQCRDDVARALGLTPQGDGYAWSALLADIKTAAKVAQAGQVPVEARAKAMQLRVFLGKAGFAEQALIAEELMDLLAAAPAQGGE